MGKLTDRAVKAAAPGKHVDGDGLMLVVSASKSKSKSWKLRYQLNGRRRDMGLGQFPDVSLATARDRAADARRLAKQGVDPIERRVADRRSSIALPTFKDIAALVVADAKERSRNAKVKYQIERHLGPTFCGPLLDRPVNEINTVDVAAVLRVIWIKKPEVARKVYPMVRRVFERARVILKANHGVEMNGNPAAWEDMKAHGFSKPKALSRGRHPSLAYSRMGEFMVALRSREATAARLMEFTILTNVRTGASLTARWRDLDMDAGIWTVPLDDLKDREHRSEPFRIPLSGRAVDILREMGQARHSEFVFPSSRGNRALSNMAMLTLLRRMNKADNGCWTDEITGKPIVVHGFRATFRTWAEEVGRFAHATIEEAMGHVVGTAAERAYRRTDVFELRRGLMNAWASHCEEKAANVVPLMRSGLKA